MSYVRLEDSFDGIHVIFVDYPKGGGGVRRAAWIATLDRAVQHTIRIETRFVTGNDNDVVRVYIDGA